MSLFSFIYSKKYDNERIKYKILGIKISKKYKGQKKQKYNLTKIRKNIIDNIKLPKTKYVSFDIFDTLLVRPCIKPTDIFALIAQKINKKYNIDFLDMRMTAEQESKIRNANIYQIYDFIQHKYNLSECIKNDLLQEEIALETQLLSVRKDVKDLYDIAVKSGKKIIAISDMYLPSAILNSILKKNGFNNIEKIYVSNEYNARKDNGTLFDIVIKDLGSNDIVHIGDNHRSDYIKPNKKGITAFHYPKIIEILQGYNKLFDKLILGTVSQNNEEEILNRNIFIGFTLNNYWFNIKEYNSKILNTISDFVNLFLAPYLIYMAFSIQRNSIIQNSYDKIYFVARDGYLPNKIYSMLNLYGYIPSEYIYGSRIAYWTGTYNSISDLLIKQHPCLKPDYTFENFIDTYISDSNVLNQLKATYTKNELKTTIKQNLKTCLDLLNNNKNVFDDYYKEQKTLTTEYYNHVISSEKERIIVFDVGYSGSISLGISQLTKKFVDKIYVHETRKNIYRDNQNQTYTFILKNGIESNAYTTLDLILEECFSPLEGTCVGFKKDSEVVTPIIKKIKFQDNMVIDHKKIQKTCELYTKELINLFGDYLKYLNVIEINCISNLIVNNFKYSPNEKKIFDNIIYNDIAVRHSQVALSKKF